MTKRPDRVSNPKGGQVPCPFCGHGFSIVIKTQRTRRVRKCHGAKGCGKQFITYEKPADHHYKKPSDYEA